jgi:hypothetical protein
MRWQNRLHQAELGWLPAPSSGIATHVIRAIHATGLTPAGLQHCRLLHRRDTCKKAFLSRKPRINVFILGLGTQSFSSGPASLGICSTPGMASADSAKGATANAIDRVSEVGDARKHLTRWLIVHCHDKNQLTQVGRIHSEFIPICCPVPVY